MEVYFRGISYSVDGNNGVTLNGTSKTLINIHNFSNKIRLEEREQELEWLNPWYLTGFADGYFCYRYL